MKAGTEPGRSPEGGNSTFILDKWVWVLKWKWKVSSFPTEQNLSNFLRCIMLSLLEMVLTEYWSCMFWALTCDLYREIFLKDVNIIGKDFQGPLPSTALGVPRQSSALPPRLPKHSQWGSEAPFPSLCLGLGERGTFPHRPWLLPSLQRSREATLLGGSSSSSAP